METQEIKFTGFLINIFYLKEFLGASKITFQNLPGGFLSGIFQPPLSKMWSNLRLVVKFTLKYHHLQLLAFSGTLLWILSYQAYQNLHHILGCLGIPCLCQQLKSKTKYYFNQLNKSTIDKHYNINMLEPINFLEEGGDKILRTNNFAQRLYLSKLFFKASL